MQFLKRYTQPHDPRWQGPPRKGPVLLLPITALFIIIWILIIANSAYISRYCDEQSALYTDSCRSIDSLFWEVENVMSAEFLSQAIWAVIPETIFLPLSHYLFLTSHLHPIYALVSSVMLSGLWMWSGVITMVLPWTWYSTGQDLTWQGLLYTTGALEVIVALMYLWYLGCAIWAVVRWARARKGLGKGYGMMRVSSVELGLVEGGNAVKG